jgi:hypothetical protein
MLVRVKQGANVKFAYYGNERHYPANRTDKGERAGAPFKLTAVTVKGKDGKVRTITPEEQYEADQKTSAPWMEKVEPGTAKPLPTFEEKLDKMPTGSRKVI